MRLARIGLVIFIAAALAGACPLSCGLRGGSGVDHLIHVNISLHSEDATPIDGVVFVGSTVSEALWARTNANGECTISGNVPSNATRLIVCIVPFVGGQTIGQQRTDGDHFKSLNDNYTVQRSYVVPLRSDTDDYSLTITCYPFVTVSGRVVDQAGQGVRTTLVWADAPNSVVTKKTPLGSFSLDRVRRARPVEIFLLGTPHGPLASFTLTSQQTAGNVSVGDIVLPALQGDAPVRVTATNFDQIMTGVGAHNREITMVAADGSRILEFPLSVSGVAMTSMSNPAIPSILPGTYYVSPGNLYPDMTAWELLRLLRAGRVAEVEAAGVPRIVAQSGVEAQVTVDGPATVNAIHQLTDQ